MRLFYGLTLPSPVRKACAETAGRARGVIPGRYALPENYHVTLLFIGCIDEARLGAAKEALAACVREFPAPRLALGELSYFHRAQNAVLVQRVHAEPEIHALHGALARALSLRGIESAAGAFSPHVTLARHARIAPGALSGIAPAKAAFVCPQAHLFLSARDGQNVLRYTPIAGAPFAKPPENAE